MKGDLISLVVLMLILGMGRWGLIPPGSRQLLAQCVPTDLPSPRDETPSPKPTA